MRVGANLQAKRTTAQELEIAPKREGLRPRITRSKGLEGAVDDVVPATSTDSSEKYSAGKIRSFF